MELFFSCTFHKKYNPEKYVVLLQTQLELIPIGLHRLFSFIRNQICTSTFDLILLFFIVLVLFCYKDINVKNTTFDFYLRAT